MKMGLQVVFDDGSNLVVYPCSALIYVDDFIERWFLAKQFAGQLIGDHDGVGIRQCFLRRSFKERVSKDVEDGGISDKSVCFIKNLVFVFNQALGNTGNRKNSCG